MDIKRSRRLLAVGAPGCGVLELIKDLTDSAPRPDTSGSAAGLTHEWAVKTEYYSANVPVWIDEIAELVTWKEDFLRSEAKEVVDAVGAWVYCFRTDADGKITEIVEETMKAIQEITEKHNVYGNDAAMLAVAMLPAGGRMSQDANSSEAQEDTCMQYGFEYILASAQGKNEFGEKVGVERLKEALEANEWSARDDEDDALGLEELDLEGDDDDTFGGFSTVEAEMTSELFGMKAALVGDDFESEPFAASPEDDESAQVEDLDRIMGRILAIKDQSADLPEAQRKRLAARAIHSLLK